MVNKTGPYIKPGTPGKQTARGPVVSGPAKQEAVNSSFHQILDKMQEKQKVNFSAHARERIESRRIELGAEDMNRIEEAIDKVRAKGSRSSLLLFGEVALLASVTNRTIITAVDRTEKEDCIFTGIDSAVILR